MIQKVLALGVLASLLVFGVACTHSTSSSTTSASSAKAPVAAPVVEQVADTTQVVVAITGMT